MVILSFAHLKPHKNHEEKKTSLATPVTHSRPSITTSDPKRKSAKVMSFAHLKSKQPQKIATEIDTGITTQQKKEANANTRTCPKIPSVAPTALLHATNYCCGCPRFIPAEEWEGKHGNAYGRCRRDDHVVEELGEDGKWHEFSRQEVWRVIPEHATVGRCWLWIQEKSKLKE